MNQYNEQIPQDLLKKVAFTYFADIVYRERLYMLKPEEQTDYKLIREFMKGEVNSTEFVSKIRAQQKSLQTYLEGIGTMNTLLNEYKPQMLDVAKKLPEVPDEALTLVIKELKVPIEQLVLFLEQQYPRKVN